eukprot:scaffold10192_cov36-Attheya_sp.AAC.1
MTYLTRMTRSVVARRRRRIACMGVILQLLVAVMVRTTVGKESRTSYSRYPHYPAYCSTPDEMKTRQIPPLPPPNNNNNKDDAATIQDSKLVQVTAIIRHGARTPWGGDHACWDGYWTNPETGVWDCELTTMTSPPPPPVVEEEEEGQPEQTSAGADAMFLFEKRYDALQTPPRLSNELNGTCQKGQLLLRGYDQELANGQHLRNAYAFYGQQGDDQGAA